MEEAGTGTAGSGEGENTDASTTSSTDASTTSSTDASTTSGDGDGDGDEDLPCGLDPDVDCPACVVPQHAPCDEGEGLDAAALIGLGCPGEIQVSAGVTAMEEGWEARTHFGTTDTWDPTEGERYLVLGTGHTSDLDLPPDMTTCSQFLGDVEEPGDLDLPAPIQETNAGDCYLYPELVGTGDCSNTIQGQLSQISFNTYDYMELRVQVTVPETVDQFSFDWAFLSRGIPGDVGSGYNDMFLVWLEAGDWTGNVALTDQGNAVSLNTIGFEPDYEPSAPALVGTCMAESGATDWNTAVAFLPPGDTVTIVFAVFDGFDGTLDSYVFIDNFRWGCQ